MPSFSHLFSKLTNKKTLLSIAAMAAVLSWLAVFAKADTDELKVYFLDVGQGDAIFIEFPDGKQILIDGGRDDKVLEELGSAMPFWDRSIDVMIATHADADHIAGLVPVFDRYEVGMVIWNGEEVETKIFETWKEAMLKEGAEILIARQGMKIDFPPMAFMEILSPVAGSHESLSRNDLSVVSRLVYGEDSFLFTGDIERRAEYALASGSINLESEVLKIAHHGSKSSSSELLLESVRPKIAIISAGKNNSYGHPHESVLQRLEKYGIGVRRTDVEGTILLRSNGSSF